MHLLLHYNLMFMCTCNFAFMARDFIEVSLVGELDAI